MDRLEALKTFVTVADHRSFAEAARRLRISPTAASRAIADLEQALGVTLLRRTRDRARSELSGGYSPPPRRFALCLVGFRSGGGARQPTVPGEPTRFAQCTRADRSSAGVLP